MTRHRICALGNSHLAAAKLGWDRLKEEFADVEVDFFGFSPGTSTAIAEHVAVDGQRLVATSKRVQASFALTSGGRTEIAADDYSAFVTFGLGVGGPSNGRNIYLEHTTVDLPRPGKHLISVALVEAYIRQRCSAARALLPFEMIRQVTAAPILMQSVPTPMTDILTSEEHANDAHVIPGLYRHLRPIFDRVCAEVGRPSAYVYVTQPVATIAADGLTLPSFIRSGTGFGGFRGGVGRKTNDYGHGNADYGEVVMRSLLERLQPGEH